MATFKDTTYFIKATKEHSKEDVYRILSNLLGVDSIDRLLSIDAPESEKRVFVVVFWRIPSVNEFHDTYTEPITTLMGQELPGALELMDDYPIFKDGHYPAPHFLRNSKNLTNEELDELGIGGPGEFVYTQLPNDKGYDNHWEMYRDGTYYMPDLKYYDKPRLEPLSAIDRPGKRPGPPIFFKSFGYKNPRLNEFRRWSKFHLHIPSTWPSDLTDEERTLLEEEKAQLEKEELSKEMKCSVFKRWRDFYLEYPKTWPKDLTVEERGKLEQLLDEQRMEECMQSPWTPECGRDPTNMVEERERMEARRIPKRSYAEDWSGCSPRITRQVTECVSPVRELGTWGESAFPSQERTYITDNQITTGKYKWVYRSFDS
jgi:hypothetical protein